MLGQFETSRILVERVVKLFGKWVHFIRGSPTFPTNLRCTCRRLVTSNHGWFQTVEGKNLFTLRHSLNARWMKPYCADKWKCNRARHVALARRSVNKIRCLMRFTHCKSGLPQICTFSTLIVLWQLR